MGSLSEDDRLKRLQSVLVLWQRLHDDRPLRDGTITDEQREDGLIDDIIKTSTPEIVAVVLEDRVARVFCGLWYAVHHFPNDPTTDYISVEGDYTAVRTGVRIAAENFAENRARPVNEYIKNSIAAELARLREQRIAAARQKSPIELMSTVLDWPRLNVAVLLEHLTFEQRDGLLELLFARVGRSSIVWLKDEPEDELLWRLWYTAVLQAYDAKLSRVFQEETHPIFVPVGESGRRSPPRGVNPAGPMHARFYEQLVDERKRAGHTVKDPQSKSRIARLTGLDRRTIAHYLGSDVQVGVAPDEKSHVRVRFRISDLQRSIEVARRKKRGRKAKGS
jgi:hypothetical protein